MEDSGIFLAPFCLQTGYVRTGISRLDGEFRKPKANRLDDFGQERANIWIGADVRCVLTCCLPHLWQIYIFGQNGPKNYPHVPQNDHCGKLTLNLLSAVKRQADAEPAAHEPRTSRRIDQLLPGWAGGGSNGVAGEDHGGKTNEASPRPGEAEPALPPMHEITEMLGNIRVFFSFRLRECRIGVCL